MIREVKSNEETLIVEIGNLTATNKKLYQVGKDEQSNFIKIASLETIDHMQIRHQSGAGYLIVNLITIIMLFVTSIKGNEKTVITCIIIGGIVLVISIILAIITSKKQLIILTQQGKFILNANNISYIILRQAITDIFKAKENYIKYLKQ